MNLLLLSLLAQSNYSIELIVLDYHYCIVHSKVRDILADGMIWLSLQSLMLSSLSLLEYHSLRGWSSVCPIASLSLHWIISTVDSNSWSCYEFSDIVVHIFEQ